MAMAAAHVTVTQRPHSRVYRVANISIAVALLTWIVVVNGSVRSYSSRRRQTSSTSSSSSRAGAWQRSLNPPPPPVEQVVRRQKCRLLSVGRLLPNANEVKDENQHGDITRRIHLPDDNDNADNSNIHRNINSVGIASQQYDDGRTYSYSVRFQQLINNTNNLHPIFNETHNNATQSTSTTMDYNPNNISSNKENNDDTIFDNLTRGFTFAALFCLSLYCLHKCCCYTCIKCGCCPDERILQARMRKLRLMKKRSYHPSATVNGGDGSPPLDTRKWAAWMMAHGGNVDTAEDSGYYYSAVVPGGSNDDDGGIWDANTDDGSTAWDDETGFVDFDETATTTTDTGGLELAVRSSNNSKSKNAIPELEYGEGEELEDESHDSRLFDADDGGQGVNREADKFFTGGGRRGGRENGGNHGIGQAGRIKHKAVVAAHRNEKSFGDIDQNQHSISEQSFFEAMQQPPLSGRNDAGSFIVHGSDGSCAIRVYSTMPQDTAPMVDAGNWERENDEDIEEMEMDSDNVDADDRGYDEETDLLGLRSDSPPPLDLEEMSRIEKKLIEDMENAKPY